MIVTFEEYSDLGGRAITSKKDYDRLEQLVEEVIDAYIKTRIPYWRVMPLEEYGIELKTPIVRQIEFVDAHGGLDYFQGNNDMALKTVTTSGFSYSMDDGSSTPKLYNLPLSPVAKTQIDYELMRSGLGSRVLL